jgi:hypothetical protein
MATTPDRLPSSAELDEFQRQQAALSDDVNWFHQPAFMEEFARLTDTPLEGIDIHLSNEWKRESNWNFTADDVSFTQ